MTIVLYCSGAGIGNELKFNVANRCGVTETYFPLQRSQACRSASDQLRYGYSENLSAEGSLCASRAVFRIDTW